MPAVAIHNDARVTPRKATEVAALVRGRKVSDALVILDNTPRRAASLIREAVKSAAANAEHNHSYKPETLIISSISISPGLRLKRYRPAWRGTAHKFQRRSSVIRVEIEGQKRELKKPAGTAAKKEAK